MGLREQSKEKRIMIKKFRKDKRGAIYAWVVVLLMMFTYSIIWFTAGFAAIEVVDSVDETFGFDERGDAVITLLKYVFAWHPILIFVGLLIYAITYSQRRDVRFDVFR